MRGHAVVIGWLIVLVWVLEAGAAPPASPYAGQESRAIKALSPQEVEDLLTGRGMGLAKAAELNHYPGPRHVLELADQLGLSAEQRVETERIFEAMQAEAGRLGAEIVAGERALDARFAEGTITASELERLLEELGMRESRLRMVHLRAHLAQRDVLTPAQRQQYEVLRGYDGTSAPAHRGHSH
ncbi:MAG TPA: Spy/CpxP family protein refolding chaperone [Verrucomicrobiae bacterium]|jgi:Spy/CpxP family protein refolding chaperone|nr:Spy/CpxP family protein refolding chaperone [Verrucomicrobiae bacterium]